MTEVAFHTGLPDKLGYACRLLRKAWRQGARVMVVGAAQELARLDQALWLFEPEEFVPHLRLRAGAPVPARLQRTPIWLVDDDVEPALSEAMAEAGVLVNLGPGDPLQPHRFARVIELVATDPADLLAARERWRGYLAEGLSPSNLPYGQSPGQDQASGAS